jgi:hypothetical protein
VASPKQINYTVHFLTAQNIKLSILKFFFSLDYTRSVNAVGEMTMTIPATKENRALISTAGEIRRDMRFEIWRTLGSRTYLETNTQWISREVVIDENNETITIRAASALTLLERRIIAYDAGSDEATKSGVADDVIVEFVNENLGSSVTDSDRDWSDKIIVRSSPSNGPTINKAASRRKLLNVIQDIGKQATVLGTPVFFDMNYLPGSQKFEFRTYTTQRGADRSSGNNQLIFSSEFNNLENITRTDDFSSEATYIYAAGQGRGDERVVVTASDVGRINSSPFGRIESLVDGRNTSSSAALSNDAESVLRQGRPTRILTGTIINRPGSEYGQDWFWGDKVKVQMDRQIYTARIDTISVSVSGGRETIQAGIRIED